ncbi:hypothetical protein SOVF_160870 [Spinacia oleracea]|nr:hypothetical protein SOVF_160870 [Spinacia oleracea]
MLKQPLHECFHNIATKYGEIILLKFGVRNVLLISSPNAVQECLVKNDTVFADRPNTLVGTLLHYNNTSIAFSPYNDHFRTLKRLLTQEVFSSTKAPVFSSIRVDECRILLRDLWSETEANTQKPMKISINKGVMECGLNIMTRITSGKRYYGKDVENIVIANVFRTLMKEGSVLSAADNPGDFLPMLKFLFRGLKKKMLAWMEKTDSFYQRILDERKKMDGSSTSTKAVIDVLISAQKQDPVFFTNEVIKGMLMDAELMYKLLPFGLGRRACPGTSMGKKAVCLVLGSLIHCFDFQRIGKEMVDMSQCNGLTMPKAIPLEALCKVRPCMANLLAKEFNL